MPSDACHYISNNAALPREGTMNRSEQDRINAVLFKERAAPEMYAALKEIATEAAERSDVNWNGTGPNVWMRIKVLVDAALARARGES